MSKYTKGAVIGRGSFGTVWKVKSDLSQVIYALKEVDLNTMSENDRQRALTEVTILSKLKHTHIIKYVDAIIDNDTLKLSIVTEYADGGDMYTAIAKQNSIPFTERSVFTWFTQICLALQYIHYRNILHRDLKSQNIFLTKSKLVKVGDFGIARVLRQADDLATTSIGTPFYLSPEICSRKPYNSKSDMWALGCLLFEIATLELPFKADDFPSLVDLILNGRRKLFPSWCSSSVKELVKNLLSSNPDERPSADEILQHPSLQLYLSNYYYEYESPKTISDFTETRTPSGVKYRKQTSPSYRISRRASDCSAKNAEGKTKVISPKNEDSSGRTRSATNQVTCGKSKFSPKPNERDKQSNNFSNRQSKLRSPKSPEADMSTTYVVSKPLFKNSNFLTVPRNEILTSNEVDCGYQSEDANAGCPDEKPGCSYWNDRTENIKSYESYPKLVEVTQHLNEISFHEDTESLSSTTCRESVSGDSSCQHDLCYHCMLYTLWKNRIRDGVNYKNLSKLKAKLLTVFNENFETVHQRLLYDWKGQEVGEDRASIKSLMKDLNFDQVQNLPLMMQLVQLEFQMKEFSISKSVAIGYK